MAGASLLTLLDDIASILDDVSVLTKVAASKTAGVLGDDLALNAQQVSGVKAERELPVVWAVAKGSFINKLILLPLALGLSYFAPWIVMPLLALGGAYLCFEGCEKVLHTIEHRKKHGKNLAELDEVEKVERKAKARGAVDEKAKIKGAIRTDFILSAEIIIISMGTVQESSFATQAAVVSVIAMVMTVGVYGLVAGIVKLDDLGLYLSLAKNSAATSALGRSILWFAPFLMKTLSIVGTVAMFVVGGGILVHALPIGHEVQHTVEHFAEGVPAIGYVFKSVSSILLNGVVGVVLGGIVLGIVKGFVAAKQALR